MRKVSESHRKRSQQDEEVTPALTHDESNWLVSYADLMTLLFGFFVLLYSLTRFDNSKFDLVRKEIAKYFGGNIKEVSAMIRAEQKLITVLKGSGDSQGVEVSKGNDDNLLLTFEGDVLFPSGAIELNEAAKPVIRKAVASLRSAAEIEKVEVQGHTDVDPVASQYIKSNWELSSLRAASVARYIETLGIPSDKLMVVGKADTHPAKPHKDQAGTIILENKSANRRVVLSVRLSDSESAFQLQQKDFKKVLSPAELDELKRRQELESQLKSAQKKYEESQARLKLAQEEKRRKTQLERMEKQIEMMNRRAEEFQEKAEDINAQ